MKQIISSELSQAHMATTEYTQPVHRRAVLRMSAWGALAASALLVGCGSSPRKRAVRSTPVLRPRVPAKSGSGLRLPNNMREQAVAQALFLINTPYRYGGSNPQTGFDCSGLVQYVFSRFAGRALPRTARQWAQASSPIRKANLQRGDLVFFNTSGRSFSHMGIYIGRGRFVHAPSSGKVVSIARLDMSYYVKRFEGARTVFA